MPVTRILPCAAALALLACLADAVAQPAQKPLAQVTVTGKESGAVSIAIGHLSAHATRWFQIVVHTKHN